MTWVESRLDVSSQLVLFARSVAIHGHGDLAKMVEEDRTHKAPTPEEFAALVAMGLDAAPALIEALDDERFTRTVGFSER